MITFKLPTRKYSYFFCQMNSCRENGLFMFCLQILVKKNTTYPLLRNFMDIWRGSKKIIPPLPPPPKIFLKVMELCSKTLPVIDKIKIYIYTVTTSRKLRLSRCFINRRAFYTIVLCPSSLVSVLALR